MEHHASGTTTTGRRVRLALVAGLVTAGVLAAMVGVAPSSGAEVQLRTYALSGTLSVGAPPALTLPAGSTFTASVDTETGQVTEGRTAIPTFTRAPATGVPAFITITDAAPAEGMLDPTTGEASLDLSLAVELDVPSLPATCSLGPVNFTATTAGGAPITGDPATGTIVAQGFQVPGVVAGPGCAQASADAINSVLGLPTVETAMSLTVVEGPIALPSTPTAEPQDTTPAFTG